MKLNKGTICKFIHNGCFNEITCIFDRYTYNKIPTYYSKNINDIMLISCNSEIILILNRDYEIKNKKNIL